MNSSISFIYVMLRRGMSIEMIPNEFVFIIIRISHQNKAQARCFPVKNCFIPSIDNMSIRSPRVGIMNTIYKLLFFP